MLAGKGFCILGESCPYDHGLDPLVIGGNIPTYGHPPSAIPGIGVPTLHPPSGHGMCVCGYVCVPNLSSARPLGLTALHIL